MPVLFVIKNVFSAFPEVEWITGRPTVFNDQGMTVEIAGGAALSRTRFFGRSELARPARVRYPQLANFGCAAGGALSTEYRVEGDFEAADAIFPLRKAVSRGRTHRRSWRFHPNSLSHADVGLL